VFSLAILSIRRTLLTPEVLTRRLGIAFVGGGLRPLSAGSLFLALEPVVDERSLLDPKLFVFLPPPSGRREGLFSLTSSDPDTCFYL